MQVEQKINGFPLIGHVYSVGTCLGLKGVLWKEDSLYRVFKSSFLYFFRLNFNDFKKYLL